MPRSVVGMAVLTAVVATAGCGGGGEKGAGDTTAGTDTQPSSEAGGSAGSCGLHEVDGVRTRTFCGDATAMLTVGGTPIELAGGECETTPAYISVNIGTAVLGIGDEARSVKAKTQYFGMNVGRTTGDADDVPRADKDGAYKANFTANDHGIAYTVTQGDVTLSDGRTKGQFTGTTLDGSAATGTFTC